MADGASVVVFDKSNKKVLLVKRRDVPLWNIPGGAIEPGETARQAAIREAQEEAGYKVKLIRKVGIWKNFKTSGTNTVYLGKIVAGKPKIGPESSEIKFFPIKSLPDTLLRHQQDRIFEASLRKQPQNYTVNYSPFQLLAPILKYPILFAKIILWWSLKRYVRRY